MPIDEWMRQTKCGLYEVFIVHNMGEHVLKQKRTNTVLPHLHVPTALKSQMQRAELGTGKDVGNR